MEAHLRALFPTRPNGFSDLATTHRQQTLTLIREWCAAGLQCSTTAALFGPAAADDVDRTGGFRELVAVLDGLRDDPLAERFGGDLAIAFFLWLNPDVAAFARCRGYEDLGSKLTGVMYRGKKSGVHVACCHPLELWEMFCR